MHKMSVQESKIPVPTAWFTAARVRSEPELGGVQRASVGLLPEREGLPGRCEGFRAWDAQVQSEYSLCMHNVGKTMGPCKSFHKNQGTHTFSCPLGETSSFDLKGWQRILLGCVGNAMCPQPDVPSPDGRQGCEAVRITTRPHDPGP